MCFTVKRLLTENSTVIEIIGCASLKHLIDVLEKNSSFNIEKLKNILNDCEKCQLERSKREELFKDSKCWEDLGEEKISFIKKKSYQSFELYEKACGTLNSIEIY